MKPKIGFSTGVLYKTNFSLEKIVDGFINAGATAVELLFINPKELLDFEPNKNFIDKLKTFSWLSIHSPWEYSNYENELETVIIKLNDLYSKLPLNGIVFHPSIDMNKNKRLATNFDDLEETGLPILIENMNNLNKYGSHPTELKSIKNNYSFGFVFDTNHAYAVDSTMELGKEILKIFGNRLKEIHASGFQNGKHIPVYLNKDEGIIKILKQNKGIPKISEGLITENLKELESELSYLLNLEI